MVDGGGQVQSLQPAGARPVRKPWRSPEETEWRPLQLSGRPTKRSPSCPPARAPFVFVTSLLAREAPIEREVAGRAVSGRRHRQPCIHGSPRSPAQVAADVLHSPPGIDELLSIDSQLHGLCS